MPKQPMEHGGPGATRTDTPNEYPAITGAPGDPLRILRDKQPFGVKVKELAEWWNKTQLGRTLKRFGQNGGGVLTGGIAYATLFSVGAALTLAFTFIVRFLSGNPELTERMYDAIASALPGIVDTGNGGLIKPDALTVNPGLNITSIIAAVVMVMTAISAIGALVTGVRQMFGQAKLPPTNPVWVFLGQIGGFIGIGLAIVASSTVTVLATGFADDVLRFLGQNEASTLLVQAIGILMGGTIDAFTFIMIVRWVAHVPAPWRSLWPAAIIAGLGLGTLRVLGVGVVAGGASRNPLLASVAAIATLLLWVNLNSRIILTAAAWSAEDYWSTATQTSSSDDVVAASAAASPELPPAPGSSLGKVGAFAAGAGVAAAVAAIRARRTER